MISTRSLRLGAARSAAACCEVPGAADVAVEQATGLPVLTIEPNARSARAARTERQRTAGRGRDGDRRRRGRPVLRGRPPRRHRRAPARDAARRPRRADAAAGAAATKAAYVPLGEVADTASCDRAPTRSIARTASGASWSRPTCAAAISVRSCRRCSARSREQVEMPAGYWIEYGGTFEQSAVGDAAPRDRRAGDAR